MMKLFWKYLLWISLVGLSLASVFSLSIKIPTPSGQEDIIVAESTIESDESTLFDVIQIINDYLWFAIAGMAMVVLVYAWIKLILAQWDKEEVTKANKMVISSMIAIFAAMLSYAIIKLVVNLF
jgi:hypothetical protein